MTSLYELFKEFPEDQQMEFIDSLWKNKPELFAKVISGQKERFYKYMNNAMEEEQRTLLVWFKKNSPNIWKEIFCEDCPEIC